MQNDEQLTPKYGGRSQTLTANTDAISDLVSRAASEMEMAAKGEKVSLRDIEKVKAISRQYVSECAAVGTLPTVRGVASRLGTTRQALYSFAKDHRGEPFDEWLEDFSDACAELTMAAAMAGTIKEVSAIFTTKARYNWRDVISVEPVTPETPLGKTADPAEIAEKYAYLLEE